MFSSRTERVVAPCRTAHRSARAVPRRAAIHLQCLVASVECLEVLQRALRLRPPIDVALPPLDAPSCSAARVFAISASRSSAVPDDRRAVLADDRATIVIEILGLRQLGRDLEHEAHIGLRHGAAAASGATHAPLPAPPS